MAKNDPANPAIARQRQDLASLPRRMSEGESHFGRGTSPFPRLPSLPCGQHSSFLFLVARDKVERGREVRAESRRG